MNESPGEQEQEDVPHDDELDVAAPTESAPGHHPDGDDESDADA